jgi:hypothetical protein
MFLADIKRNLDLDGEDFRMPHWITIFSDEIRTTKIISKDYRKADITLKKTRSSMYEINISVFETQPMGFDRIILKDSWDFATKKLAESYFKKLQSKVQKLYFK